MTIISALRSWLQQCPLLSGGVLQVDFLQPEWGSYSIESAVTAPVIRTYMDGSTRRQQDFNLVSRHPYGGEVLLQLENIGFYEALQGWIEAQLASRSYPDLGTGRTCIGVSAISCGYPVGEDGTGAYYQISLRLTYLQEA